ncbi:xyloglucan endotransglucosylase/hydrolase protein 8-related [Anaeramoeba flamelloides]|uniref:Xyloglucan endotransglucosylase/hydrolase protein 8-related n=1 Tax=Anaeramoeba flamelloides TaxID=1746091 RepID=A0AAV7YJ00_9EUKA|nr:xyloglucan endotransglucosylase/hydrolase protein 8-related [Anaeramoeba flamelloides]
MKNLFIVLFFVFLIKAFFCFPDSFDDDFTSFNETRWRKGGLWTNGGDVFQCCWRQDECYIEEEELVLKISDEGCPDECDEMPYASGELRSRDLFTYGTFFVNMKPAAANGTVSSFFTYTSPSDASLINEIDIEILPFDPQAVQFNVWRGGVQDPYKFDLDFDPFADYHEYSFKWERESVTFYVDNKQAYKYEGEIYESEGMKIMANLWPCKADNWCTPPEFQIANNEDDKSKYKRISYTTIEDSNDDDDDDNNNMTSDSTTLGLLFNFFFVLLFLFIF